LHTTSRKEKIRRSKEYRTIYTHWINAAVDKDIHLIDMGRFFRDKKNDEEEDVPKKKKRRKKKGPVDPFSLPPEDDIMHPNKVWKGH